MKEELEALEKDTQVEGPEEEGDVIVVDGADETDGEDVMDDDEEEE